MDHCIFFIHWHNKNEILQLLDQLNHAQLNWPVVVIDNQGDLKIEQKNVFILDARANVGYARACNMALDWAQKNNVQYLLFSNTDIQCDFLELNALLQKQLQEQWVAISPVIVEQRNAQQSLNFGGRDPVKYLDSRIDAIEDLDKLMYLPGTFLLMEVDPVIALGGLDADYFFSGEIADLFFRINKANLAYGLVMDMKVKHIENGRKSSSRCMYIYYTMRNRYLLIERNYHQNKNHWISVWNKRIFRQKVGALLRMDWSKYKALDRAQKDGLNLRFGKSPSDE